MPNGRFLIECAIKKVTIKGFTSYEIVKVFDNEINVGRFVEIGSYGISLKKF